MISIGMVNQNRARILNGIRYFSYENYFWILEISLVENAVYTDPKDQSAWFYHRWLLSYLEQSYTIAQGSYDSSSGKAWVTVHPFHPSICVQSSESSWGPLNGDKCSNIFVST